MTAYWQPNISSWHVVNSRGYLGFTINLIDLSNSSVHSMSLTFSSTATSPFTGYAYGSASGYGFYVTSNDFEYAKQVEFMLETSGTKQVSVYNFSQPQPTGTLWNMQIDALYISSAEQPGLAFHIAQPLIPEGVTLPAELDPVLAQQRKAYDLTRPGAR